MSAERAIQETLMQRETNSRGRDVLVSLVIPACNEAANVPRLYDQLLAAMAVAGHPFEIVIVDDGSCDETLQRIKALRAKDPRVHYVSFTRNFGHQAALIGGLAHAHGGVVISLDADLQHPPALLPRMLELWRGGADIVHTTKGEDASAGMIRRWTSRAFYRVFVALSGVELGFGQADFRLLDARVVRELLRIPEHGKFLRGLVSWMGFSQATLDYKVDSRHAGRPSYTFSRRLWFHVDAILAFSVVPLRLFTVFGLVMSFTAGTYGLVAFVVGLHAYLTGYSDGITPGWASIAIFVTFLGGIQLIGIGILGEYLGRVLENVKGRPTYLVDETSIASHAPALGVRHATRDSGDERGW